MDIRNVNEKAFTRYGRVLERIEFSDLIRMLQTYEIPEEVVYVPSVAALETGVSASVSRELFGELPIQIGYCMGHNRQLNALEYHRSSEINVAARDMILLLGLQTEMTEAFQYDTGRVEAFLVPEGTAVELYATTLHYAPCQADDDGFCTAVILPKGTNAPLTGATESERDGENRLLAAVNKWLIGHPEGGLPDGSFIGLQGENIKVES